MYSGPINPDNADSNTVESIVATGERISFLNKGDALYCEIYRFNHYFDGWKYAVIFYDETPPSDFTDLSSAEYFANEMLAES